MYYFGRVFPFSAAIPLLLTDNSVLGDFTYDPDSTDRG